MKIACITYRKWAKNIYEKLIYKYKNKCDFLVIYTIDDFDEDRLISFDPNLILWYGWSSIVSENLVTKYNSIMLHPSPLPKYRGGSPIQNQIIRGEKKSAVTLFKMTKNLDDGGIYFQEEISFEGSLNSIFKRITKIGFKGTCKIIDGDYKVVKQNHKYATYFKRRKPEDSEITIEEIKNNSAEYIYNKIRMLDDPYPNAFIMCGDNKKIYIKKSILEP